MNETHTYQVFRCDRITGKWLPVTGAWGQRGYVLGWFHALTGFYPRPAYEMRRDDGEVIERSRAVEAPRPA
jgi:hypothetical protein